MGQKRGPYRPARPRVACVCRECGRDFLAHASICRRGPKAFCSNECYLASRGTLAERFARFVDTSGDCHVWTGHRDRDGYGKLSVDGVSRGAHRVSYFLRTGNWPAAVRHDCDNPPCVRFDHLKPGTVAENNAERSAKGRSSHARLSDAVRASRRGEGNPAARLTAEQVRRIRSLYAAGGVTQKALATQFDVSHALISFIVTRRIWKEA